MTPTDTAVQALGQSPEAVAQHGAATVQRLEDSDGGVRMAAVKALGQSPEAVAQHGAAIVQRLEDSDGGVRMAAVVALGQSLEALALTTPELIRHTAHNESAIDTESAGKAKSPGFPPDGTTQKTPTVTPNHSVQAVLDFSQKQSGPRCATYATANALIALRGRADFVTPEQVEHYFKHKLGVDDVEISTNSVGNATVCSALRYYGAHAEVLVSKHKNFDRIWEEVTGAVDRNEILLFHRTNHYCLVSGYYDNGDGARGFFSNDRGQTPTKPVSLEAVRGVLSGNAGYRIFRILREPPEDCAAPIRVVSVVSGGEDTGHDAYGILDAMMDLRPNVHPLASLRADANPPGQNKPHLIVSSPSISFSTRENASLLAEFASQCERWEKDDDVLVLNGIEARKLSQSKYGTVLNLQKKSVETIPTMPLFDPQTKTTLSDLPTKDEIGAALKSGPPWILKPDNGSQGKGVERIKDYHELKSKWPSLAGPHVLQKYMQHSCGVDVRAFMVDGEIISVYERVASSSGEFRSNIDVGGVAREVVLLEQATDAARRAYKVSDLFYVGIDLLYKDEQRQEMVINELNAAPGGKGPRAISGQQVFADVARLALEKWDQFEDQKGRGRGS